ncbi:MAG: hypothetical protein A3K19_06290 [Lentisphaerae bacterium RIFOXYB12_FULL_65_16]|nr:MAG: hypothetical protein A3K18_26755 [Lentisphaerae bacterium RIFOXYA12_64_32]OGV93231.1 MAG: hypothetical protein A3K19_06290 [Lentisphaerae bacterium RIFOXYB12_FULL_65_16]
MLHGAPGRCLPVLAIALAAATFSATSATAGGQAPATGSGQALGVKHPVLDHKLDPAQAAEYEAGVQRVMTMGEERMLSFMPDWAYARFCECPACYGGVEGNGIFTWTVERPDEMKCRFCGLVWPDPKYPEDKVLAGTNKLGEEVSLPYHLNEEKKIPHFLGLHLLLLKRQWLETQCVGLGKAYRVTGKEEYAHRVVLVLDKLAQRYPHYPVLQNGVRRVAFRESQDVPYAWDSGKWGCFHDEIPKSMVNAYDLVCESREFDSLSQQRGYDVREKLENDCFRKTFEAIEKSPYHVSNVTGYDIAGAALLGRVINEPGYVHRAFGWMKQNLDEGFYRDGMWNEGSPAYHAMTIGGLRYAFSTVLGHSDPPGYTDPVDGTRFDNLDPEKQVTFWAKCITAPAVITAPNGFSANVHDTHPYAREAPARDKTVSTIMPAFGHVSLGRGTGADQMQAQLHFSGAYGHSHADNLNLMLWVKGHEMLPDVGYTWTQMRCWTTCTLGHNTVVIDRKDQAGRPGDGELLQYFPNSSGVAVGEAEGRRAYSNIKGVEVYRRLVIMVPVSAADAYVVDIFRVRGGAMHDWTLNGDADQDTTAVCSLPLTGNRKWMLEDGEEWQEPTIVSARHHAYGMVRDVQRADAAGSFQVSFTYTDRPDCGLRAHVLPGGPAEVWLGRSPSVRRMGQGTGGDMRKGYDFWMPKLLVRRSGVAPLESQFVAVEEPFSGYPFITAVERLDVTPADVNAVALRVRHGQAIDTIISTLDAAGAPDRTAGDGVVLRGGLGIVRQVNGQVTGGWLFGGEELRVGDFRLTGAPGEYRGQVQAAMRKADGAAVDAFITDAVLPAGTVLHGVWLVLTYGSGFTQGFEIDRVETQDGKTVIVLTDDHGLRIDGEQTQEVYFPRRKSSGVNTFRMPLAMTLCRE